MAVRTRDVSYIESQSPVRVWLGSLLVPRYFDVTRQVTAHSLAFLSDFSALNGMGASGLCMVTGWNPLLSVRPS